MNPPITDPIVPGQSPLPKADSMTDRNGVLPDQPAEDAEAEEIQYNPIPPRRVITISVQYVLQGRGKPLPYELDEEVSE
jgi:hypothetical protein